METMFTRIKNKRLELKMSQEDLAAKVGYSDKSAISHLEKGELDLPQSKIVAIADAHTPDTILKKVYTHIGIEEMRSELSKLSYT